MSGAFLGGGGYALEGFGLQGLGVLGFLVLVGFGAV